MKLAFDARCFSRSLDSMDRVLRVLVCAAQHAGWEFELWTDGPPRPDVKQYEFWIRRISGSVPSDVDVIWSPEISFYQTDVPSVATLHDVNPLLPDGRSALARWRRKRRFLKQVDTLLNGIQRLIADTEDARMRVTEVFPRAAPMLSVVPLFVDPDIVPITGEDGAVLLNGKGLSQGFILCVGSVRRHKNWHGLIRAFAALPPSLRDAHPLVFAGRAKRARGEAEQLALAMGVADQVHILGPVEDRMLHALYGGASLLAFPSFMEGFGFPPLEALACGVPVVATDRTCVPEVLGDAAEYIDPTSNDSLRDGLELVLTDDSRREQLIAAGFERAQEFNPARTAAAMERVIAGLT